MGLSGFFGKRNLSKIEPDIEFPAEIYANKPFPMKIRLKNNKRFLPGFLLRITVDANEALFPFVDVRDEAAKHITFSIGSRGKYEIRNIHICSAFPFYFFIRCRTVKKQREVIVFPEPVKCELFSHFGEQSKTAGEKAYDRTGFEPDIISIRDYMQGDPLKYVNWKASAKTGKLKTKELSSMTHQPVMIDFDKIDIKNTETKISCITYTVLHLFKKNIPVGIKVNERLYKPDVSGAHKISIMKELALYGME